MNAWLPRVILPLCLLVAFSTAAVAQLVVTDDFESNNPGDFPVGWTQVNGSVGYALATSSPVASGTRAVRLSAGLSTASTIRITTAITNDYVYEYHVLIPDTGVVNDPIGSVKVENVGMSFALGSTTAEGVIYFSSLSDGLVVPTNVYHHVKVEVDYQKNVARVTVNGAWTKKYPISINTSQDLRLEASSLSSALQKHIVYVDSVTVSLMTVDLTPAFTSLSSPSDGATGLGSSSAPSFSWSSVSQATGYHLQISTDSTFATGVVYDDTTLTGTSKSVPLPPLATSTDYYWRVRAKNTIGWGDWSAPRRFRTVDPPGPPTLYGPSDGQAYTSADQIYFYWSNPSGSQAVQFQLSEDSLFTAVVLNDSASSNDSYKYVDYPPLEILKRYYWRVRSLGIAGWGTWSEVYDLTTPYPLAPPTLGAPSNGLVTTELTQIYFWWNSVSGATGYWLQIAKDSNFTVLAVNDSTLGSTAVYQYFPPLEYNTTYYWRVRTKNAAGWGTFSGWRWLKTKPTPTITLSSPNNGSLQSGETVNISGSTSYSDGADSFYVEIALDSLFTQIVIDSVSDNSYFYINLYEFAPNTTYYWRMRARNVAGWGPLSGWRTFVITAPPVAPSLSSPANNATVTSLVVYFSWGTGGASNIIEYQLQIAADSLFTQVLVDTLFDYSGQYVGSPNLQVNQKYYWRVRTRAYVGWGAWAAPRAFFTPQRPNRPTIVSPAAGSANVWGSVTIRWTSTPGKDSSHIQISTDTSTAAARTLGGGKGRVTNGSTVMAFHYGPVYETNGTAQINVDFERVGNQMVISGSGFNDLLIGPSTQVFFRVQDFNEGGTSDWSTWSDCSALSLPTVPTGCEPADGSTGVPFIETPFSAAPNLTPYTALNVSASTFPDMSAPIFTRQMFDEYGDESNRFFAFGPTLASNTTYYYQIVAYNGAGATSTPIYSFRTADPAPVLTCVMDVENDQGGFIDVDFLASELDKGPTVATGSPVLLTVTDYSGWRIHPPGSVDGYYEREIEQAVEKLPKKIRDDMLAMKTTDLWEPVFGFPAIGEDHYRVTVKSRTDSGKHGTGWERFVVIAHASTGHQFRSQPDSGYSKDNLAPAPPVGGSAAFADGQVRVTWTPNDEADLKEYVVYRSLSGGDDVSSLTPIGTTTEPVFVDGNPPNVPAAYYYVVARDKHDNDGEPAIVVATIVTGVESLDGVPTEFVLGQNYPNPFNPSTTVRFGVPERSAVRVQVINTLGQVVEDLVDGELPAGYFQSVWNARVPSGLYFLRMVATSSADPDRQFRSIKKMVLLK